jgi:hypothetical protein
MANTIVGSIVANDLVAIASHQAGNLTFGPLNVPAGFTQLEIVFDLRQVTSLTAILGSSVEISFDSGGNWVSAGANELNLADSGYVLTNGVLTRSASDPLGPGPVRIFGKKFMLKQCNLTTRQVRGVLSASEALISGVTFVGF